MFSLREFIKKGFLNAIGKMEDYQVILNSAEWCNKGVLLTEDLAEINAKIEEQYILEEEQIIEENSNNEKIEEIEEM